MTVAELMEKLQKLDPELPIVTPGFDEGELELAVLSMRTVLPGEDGLYMLSEYEIAAGETNDGRNIEKAFPVVVINFQE